MYIIEWIIKKFKEKNKSKEIKNAVPDVEMPEKCSHIFLPIDSTLEVFACSNCGLVVKKDRIKTKPKNPFD